MVQWDEWNEYGRIAVFLMTRKDTAYQKQLMDLESVQRRYDHILEKLSPEFRQAIEDFEVAHEKLLMEYARLAYELGKAQYTRLEPGKQSVKPRRKR